MREVSGLSGCVTAGKTLEEARKLAIEALTLHMAGMLEDGNALPNASTLDQLVGDPAMRGAVAAAGERRATREDSADQHYSAGEPDRDDRPAGDGAGNDAVGIHGAVGVARTDRATAWTATIRRTE